jgi:hypothetical protein
MSNLMLGKAFGEVHKAIDSPTGIWVESIERFITTLYQLH